MLWLIVIALIFFFVDWRLGAFLTLLAVVGYVMTVWQHRGQPVPPQIDSRWGTPAEVDPNWGRDGKKDETETE